MTEIELCQHVINFYRDWETYKEVYVYGGRCDIVVDKNKILVGIEAKLQFSKKVIYQAMQHIRYVNYVYVAVPGKCYSNDYPGRKICEAMGIGIISVWDSGRVEISVQAQFNRRIPVVKLEEKQKYAIAGAQNNNMSDFKVTTREIEKLVKENPEGVEVSRLFEKNWYHWSSCRSARSCFVGYVNAGVLKQFVIKKGLLMLRPPDGEKPEGWAEEAALKLF